MITLWKYKKWIAIAVFFILYLMQIAYTNKLAGDLKNAEAKCTANIQKLKQQQIEALAIKQNKINKVSADYEQIKSEQRVKVETVTHEVQKIIERPVYQRYCFDNNGVSAINSLVAGNTSEPP